MDLDRIELAALAVKRTLDSLLRIQSTALPPAPSVEMVAQAILFVCLFIAGADGPLTAGEIRVLRILFPNELPNSFETQRGLLGKAGSGFIMEMIDLLKQTISGQASTRHSLLGDYQAQNDFVISALSVMGQCIVAADENFDQQEIARLTLVTSMLREHASSLRLQSVSDKRSLDETSRSAISTTRQDPDNFDELLSRLHRLVGLDGVKEEVETLANLGKVFKLRQDRNMPTPDISFHLVFTGNPGTGKTTVARIISKLYAHLGLISSGQLVEVDRSGLIANYVGQTASKVRDVVAKAKGGVLFIDEAYSLSRGGEGDYGREAIETLLKCMEDFRDDLVVIIAGYGKEILEFLQSNPGLQSRFPKVIDFPDYTAEELFEIFKRLAAESHVVTPDALQLLETEIQRMWIARTTNFGNAREVRNLFERIISVQANRIARLTHVSDQDLTLILAKDVEILKRH